ncbi:hypothetical protein [Nocardia sp. NBC_00511]|uniref:hypothetical protein n=1 Tax=Nocardia sp. NBC_00511 TaxID=2903591 RepID=UPI0030E2568D
MIWQSLSQRIVGAAPDGPYEGVPGHLRVPLLQWFKAWGSSEARNLSMRLRIALPIDSAEGSIMAALCDLAGQDDDLLLDLVDATLRLAWEEDQEFPDLAVEDDHVLELDEVLRASASVWKVSDDSSGLTRIVGEQMQDIADTALGAEDASAAEIGRAWSNAFGRNGDPSDAWDHSIKAIEDVLIPVVVPNKAKATLGDVLGTLNSAQSATRWEMVLPGGDQSHDVAPLVAMLRLLWPNPDRHGGGAKTAPSVEQARAAASLAALILHWHHSGWVVRRRMG